MKNFRLIYSDFSSKLTDFGYLIRAIWIVGFGFFLVVFYAFESGSGFAGSLTREGYLIFATFSLFFFLNYLTYCAAGQLIWLTVASLLSLGINLVFTAIAYHHFRFVLFSMLGLALYTIVIALISVRHVRAPHIDLPQS